jgi:hypothetical protein
MLALLECNDVRTLIVEDRASSQQGNAASYQ